MELALPAGGAARARTRFRVLHLVAAACLLVAFLPIALGAIVTSLDVGMAVPDWPTTFEQNMFTYPLSEMTQSTGVFFEHSHRLAGALIGMCSIGLVAAAFFTRGTRRSWRWLALAALALVIVQGILGGLRVLENERALAMVHGIGAQVVLTIFVVLWKLTSAGWQESAVRAGGVADAGAAEAGRMRMWSLTAAAVLFVHLFAGAGLRHQQASMTGHIVLAAVVSFALLAVVRLALLHFAGRRPVARGARALVSLLGLQLGLGLATWAFKYGPAAPQSSVELHATLATVHLLVGAVVLAVAVGLAMESWLRLPARQEAPA